MKIEVWSDIVCPFCYIGKRRLDEALAKFPHSEHVEVEFKSYQLDPNASPYTGQDYYENLAAKFNSVEQAKQITANLAEHAKSVGLTFNFANAKPTNTFDAHRLTKFAKEHGKDIALSEKLFQAHFVDAKDVGDIETLTEIAEDVGLNKEEALASLQNEQAYADEVNVDIHEARQFGISGVPYFIINRKYAISGAQPAETFTQALEKVWAEEKSTPVFQDLATNNDDSAACGDDGCAVPDQKE